MVNEPRASSNRLFWALLLVVLALSTLLCTWAVPYVPTNDGPQHLISATVESRLAQGNGFYLDHLSPEPEYAARGFALIYGPLSALMRWDAALRATWLVTVVLTVAGACLIASSVRRGRAPAGLLVLLVPYGWSVYMGFFPYVIGESFGLLLLGAMLRWREPRFVHWLLLGVGLLFQSHLHLVSALTTGMCLGVVVLVRDWGRVGWLRLCWLVLASLPTLVLLAFASHGPKLHTNHGDWFDVWVWATPVEWLVSLPRLLAPGPAWRAALTLVLVAFGLALGARQAQRLPDSENQRAVLALAALLFVLSFAAPRDTPDWQFFAQRFLRPAFVCALCALPFEELERWASERGRAHMAEIIVLLTGGLGLLATFSLHRRLEASCSDVFASLGHGTLPPRVETSMRLPLNFSVACSTPIDVPFSTPLIHAGALFSAIEGGLEPYLFQGLPSVHNMSIRSNAGWPPIPPMQDWAAGGLDQFHQDAQVHKLVTSRWAAYGTAYDGVLVFGALPGDFSELESRGYVFDRRRGGFGAAHFVPCPVSLTLPAGQASAELRVRLGLVPDERPLLSRVFKKRGAEPEGNALHAQLGAVPCGNVWIQARDAAGPLCDLKLVLTHQNHDFVCAR